MKSRFLLFILVLPLMTYAQAWDYINFTTGSGNGVTNACIDEDDNVYAIGDSDPVIRKFNPSGDLVWEKDIADLLGAEVYMGFGGMDYQDDDVYAVGRAADEGNGVILRSGTALGDVPFIWDEIVRTPSVSTTRINDLQVVDNFIYVVGSFGLSDISTTISFFDGTTLNTSRPTFFIAKYAILPSKTLIWAKTVTTIDSPYFLTLGESIAVDELGNLFVSGKFRGTSIFYDGDTPHVFTSSDLDEFSDSFLAKFDNNGNFDTAFGLKVQEASGDSRESYDVAISEANEAVYWSESENIQAYKKNGPGAYLWTRNIDHSTTYSIEANRCGDIYITGRLVNTTRAICGGDYFAYSLGATDGSTVWSSTSTSCMSYGAEVLMDSNNKEILLGAYRANGTSELLTIDDDYTATSLDGYFIGRYDDEPLNSCCKDAVNIDFPTIIRMCDADFEELCGPLSSFPSPMYTYEWWKEEPGDILQSTSRCFTPDSPGNYTLVVTDENGCVTIHNFSIVMYSPFVPELTDITDWCPEDMTMPLIGWTTDPFLDHPCAPDYQWTYNGTIVDGATGYTVPFMGPGTYCVLISFDMFSVTRCMDVVECCEPNTAFSVNWEAGGDGTYSIILTNVSSDYYVTDTYYLEKDCNNDGIAGPWEYVGEITRDEFDDPVIFTGLDPDCLYRITHRVPSPCKMKVFVHTEYVGGNPGNPHRGNLFGNGENKPQLSSTVFPNPASGVVNLYIENVESSCEVRLYDLQGRLLMAFVTTESRMTLDVEDLDAGIYLVEVSSDIGTVRKRIVKQ